MTEDELALLVRSYADQAARGKAGVTVAVNAGSDEVGAYAEIRFTARDAGAVTGAKEAATAAGKLLAEDASVTHTRTMPEGVGGLTVLLEVDGRPRTDVDADEEGEQDYAEDAELAEQLQPMEGPIELTIRHWPELVANRKTRAIAVGFNIVGKRWVGKVYWEAELADVERARYWGLKREREHKTHGYRASAALYWQHGVTTEQVVAEAEKAMNASE